MQDQTQQTVGAALKQDIKEIKQQSAVLVDRLIDLGVLYGLRLLGVIILLIVAWMLAKWARRAIYKALHRPHFDETLVRFLSNSARWAILVLAIVASLSLFGVDTTSLAAILGAVGIAVGLALQGSLSNIAAGIMLLVLRPFHVGDSVRVAGTEGRVDDIDLFSTKIDTPDNRRLILPNSQVFGSPIENLTHNRTRRVDLVVRTAYDADITRTRQVLERLASGVPQRLSDHPPEIALTDLGPGSMTWQVSVWSSTAASGAARDALAQSVRDGLVQERIGISYAAGSVFIQAPKA